MAEDAFHQPTGAVFCIYPAASTADLATISIFQIRARLAHACDGFAVHADLPALAASAIIAFAYMTLQLRPVELRPYHPAFAAGVSEQFLNPVTRDFPKAQLSRAAHPARHKIFD